MFTALQAGQVDVAMTDTAIVLGQAAESHGLFTVIGQYSTGEKYGALFPKGSKNEATLNKVLQALIDDGTTKKLAAKYLAAAWGQDPTKIPYWKS
jgi:polar amino acid transport system substrate-binding protein